MKRFSTLTQTFIYDIIRELQRQGEDGHVLALKRENSFERPFPNVDVVPIPPRWDPRRVWHKARSSLRIIREGGAYTWPMYRSRLPGCFERLNPDIIHAHFGLPGILVAPVSEQMGIPLVVSFYGYDISKMPREDAVRREYESLWNTVAAVIVLSEEMRSQAVKLGCSASKIKIVHLSRDLTDLAPRETRQPVRSFLSVGRLTEKKGHLDTIKAFQRVHEPNSQLRLRIIGEGHLEEELANYIQSNDLGDFVDLVGPLPNQEVLRELEAADAFILSSRTAENGDKEGTPTVLIEAQLLGLPCISTLHAGIPEMIPPENHWLLAEEGNVPEIADRIQRLLACTPAELTRIAARGRAKVQRDFNLAREVEKLRGVYAELLRVETLQQ